MKARATKLAVLTALLLIPSAKPAVALPLPERHPNRAEAPAPAEIEKPAWSAEQIATAKEACARVLASVDLDYEYLKPIREGACGTPQPILVRSIGNAPKVRIEPPATVTCDLAATIAHWPEKTVQPEARAQLGAPVVKLRNASSYACRNRYGSADQPLSEHARANAFDISMFQTASGRQVTVQAGWPQVLPAAPSTPPLPEPKPTRHASAGGPALSTGRRIGNRILEIVKAQAAEAPQFAAEPTENAESDFLRKIHGKACSAFGTVLGPRANEAHHDHFHLDMAQRRSSYCQ
jgi:hypothetical protein